MSVERVLRWLFRPKVVVVPLAKVTLDEARGVLKTDGTTLGLSLSVSYGYISTPDGLKKLGPSEHEVRGPCIVQATYEQPWGLHRWWLRRLRGIAEASGKLELTMTGVAQNVKIPAGTAFKSADGRDFYSERPVSMSVSMGARTAVHVRAYKGFGLWVRRWFVWPLRRVFDRRK
jgi:hypothetical protein